jgi:excisionase family DNA binding protein
MTKQEMLSTSEAAKILGVSRITVFNRIKNGQIKAKKIGRNFIIPKNELGGFLTRKLTPESKREIEKAVQKTVKEYGETLRLLGKND